MAKRLLGCFLAGAFLVPGPVPAFGQTTVDFTGGPNWLVGYVANAPQQLVGFGTGAVLPALRGFGFYLDAKFTIDSPASGEIPLDSRTPQEAEELGDLFFREDSAWTSVNVAAVRGVTSELALYLGGGASWRTSYSQYEDLTGERGHFGLYWVEDDARSGVHANFIGGAFFRMGNRLVFQFGAEAAPAGFTAGLHLRVR